MLSTTSRYALGVLRFLAARPEDRIQAVQLARVLSVPGNYLSKVLNQLRKQGFLTGQKGWSGGFQINPAAWNRRLIEVVSLFDGPQKTGSCLFSTKACDETHPCPAHDGWIRIQRDYQQLLRDLTLRDMARQPSETFPLGRRKRALEKPAVSQEVRGEPDEPVRSTGPGLESTGFID
jgi:Rrf2 family protein